MDMSWLRGRVKQLNNASSVLGKYVLYWMQSSQRAKYNHALEYSINEANRRNQPLLVYFGLTHYPEANSRHYRFMLEGLKETFETLWDQGAQPVIQMGDPPRGCLGLLGDASILVLDRGYQRIQCQWYNQVAENSRVPVVQVESNVVVPVDVASPKEEYMAVHLRRKISPLIDSYLVNVPLSHVVSSTSLGFESLDFDINQLIKTLNLDTSIKPGYLKGGRKEAQRNYTDFIENKLDGYADARNDPNNDQQSHMSPYLHFGQISPIELAINLPDDENGLEYREQLIVRRELAFNMVYYNPHYDSIECLPDWAQNTLAEHSKDKRPYLYSLTELEQSKTHDPYWNKAQTDLVETGTMHGYMRMYWGKKILEWTKDPETGYKTALYLNNKYELDGRSCNGYTGVAWCFGKHDQAWRERAIFGKVRYMNDKGLERKFDMAKYLGSGFNI